MEELNCDVACTSCSGSFSIKWLSSLGDVLNTLLSWQALRKKLQPVRFFNFFYEEVRCCDRQMSVASTGHWKFGLSCHIGSRRVPSVSNKPLSMSDSLHTPLQLDDIKENASQEKTPDDWFRSPTVKTLKRRQLQLGRCSLCTFFFFGWERLF